MRETALCERARRVQDAIDKGASTAQVMRRIRHLFDCSTIHSRGNVRITRGQNQLNGAEAEVNVKTGISRLLSAPAQRVQGLVMPNDSSSQQGAAGKAAQPGSGKATQGKRP